MDARVKSIMDNAEIWVGQCWSKKSSCCEEVWPGAVVVMSISATLEGQIVTVATRPVSGMGKFFPIRADLLVDNYYLKYDHATNLGLLESRFNHLADVLNAIRDFGRDVDAKALAEAALKRDQEEWETKTSS